MREEVYDRFQQEWSKNKASYVKKGITSIAGFVAYLLEEEVSKRFASNEPRFIMRNHDDKGVKVWDSELRLHADVQISPRGAYCPICDATRCEHIRFALSQEDVQEIIRKKGWKIELPED